MHIYAQWDIINIIFKIVVSKEVRGGVRIYSDPEYESVLRSKGIKVIKASKRGKEEIVGLFPEVT